MTRLNSVEVNVVQKLLDHAKQNNSQTKFISRNKAANC